MTQHNTRLAFLFVFCLVTITLFGLLRKRDPVKDVDRLFVPRINHGIASYTKPILQRLKSLTSRKAASLDPELVQLVREIMDPPSDEGTLKLSFHPVLQTPQSLEVEKILNEKRAGFFVECGAFDGERVSNTFFMEKERSWSGILIEMDPHYYTQLLGKNRRSWSLNACLSPYNYVTELAYTISNGQQGTLDVNAKMVNEGTHGKRMVNCFPFDTIMAGLNRTHVDYFSLDVEGFELEVLKTIDFRKITIDVLSVEHIHGRSPKEVMRVYMQDQGYRMHKELHHSDNALNQYTDDYIFVKN